MGYIVRDAVGPAITSYVTATRMRNQILRHWPTTFIDGREVFADVTYYNGAVVTTPTNLAIYKLLGMSVAELQAQDYTGIDRCWLYVNGVNIEYAVTNNETAGYIEEFSPLVYPDNPDVFNPDPNPDPVTDLNPDPFKNTDDAQWDNEGWCYGYLTYAPPSTVHIAADTSDDALIALAQANDQNSLWFDDDDSNRLTTIALLDTTDLLFQKELRVVEKVIEDKTRYNVNLNRRATGSSTSRYIVNATIQFRFRRIVDANDATVVPLLDKVGIEVAKLDDILKTGRIVRTSIRRINTVQSSLYSSQAKQLTSMYTYVVPISETNLNYAGKLKVAGLSALNNKQFVKTFLPQVANGYSKKKTKWYKKALVVIIDIIVIVIAVVVFVFTGGNFKAVSVVFALGAMVQSALAAYWARNGDYTAAEYAGKHAQFLATGAMVAGVAAVVNGIYETSVEQAVASVAAEAAKGTVNEAIANAVLTAANEAFTDALLSAAVMAAALSAQHDNNEDLGLGLAVLSVALTGAGAARAQTTGQVLNGWISTLNQSFNAYARYVNPPDKGIEEKQKQIEAQEKALEDYSSPETLDVTWREFTDPYNNYVDTNAKMDEMSYVMTHGRNRSLMHRYYNCNY